jgi:hypothetical protein
MATGGFNLKTNLHVPHWPSRPAAASATEKAARQDGQVTRKGMAGGSSWAAYRGPQTLRIPPTTGPF